MTDTEKRQQLAALLREIQRDCRKKSADPRKITLQIRARLATLRADWRLNG